MKRILWFGVAVVVVFACSEPLGQILTDAGDAMMPDAGADFEATCNKSEQNPDTETKLIYHWAEFEIDPGKTEVTICYRYAADALPPHRNGVFCWRSKANWKQGTTTGFVNCGTETDDGWRNKPESITVHD
jgi:hypothetical protein